LPFEGAPLRAAATCGLPGQACAAAWAGYFLATSGDQFSMSPVDQILMSLDSGVAVGTRIILLAPTCGCPAYGSHLGVSDGEALLRPVAHIAPAQWSLHPISQLAAQSPLVPVE
jgi:hypothetical protein